MKTLLSGNEAVARGAYEAGCSVATGFPGTPGTEILQNLLQYDEIYCEWSVNEKVGFEVACGASIAGARALSAMKHVGLNVAADPLFTFAYEGVNGGFVFVSADDPGFHSSQNEQDNRNYARHAKVAMLEPSNSQECLDFTKQAFELSERFDTPVLLRMTTRICHTKTVVETGHIQKISIKPYSKDTSKYVMMPPNAKKRHIDLEQKLQVMAAYAENCPFNKIEWGNRKIGIITSGISYQYAKEVLGENASYLKLGFTHPLPVRLIRAFAAQVEKLFVIEENDPFIEIQVKALGIPCIGKALFPCCGELNTEIVRSVFFPGNVYSRPMVNKVPARPPVLCPGCLHRGLFYALSKYKDIMLTNDIGCYTLGMSLPAAVTDTCLCMGGGFTVGMGMEKANGFAGRKNRIVGVVGDSTFFHSGITGLADAVFNGSKMVFIILDNSSTAMTGHQENPGTGRVLSGKRTKAVSIEKIVRALGIEDQQLRVIDPLNLEECTNAVKDAYHSEELFVILAKRPCGMMVRERIKSLSGIRYQVNPQKCAVCGECLEIGCPAISIQTTAVIEPAACHTCGLCAQVCPTGAIEKVFDR